VQGIKTGGDISSHDDKIELSENQYKQKNDEYFVLENLPKDGSMTDELLSLCRYNLDEKQVRNHALFVQFNASPKSCHVTEVFNGSPRRNATTHCDSVKQNKDRSYNGSFGNSEFSYQNENQISAETKAFNCPSNSPCRRTIPSPLQSCLIQNSMRQQEPQLSPHNNYYSNVQEINFAGECYLDSVQKHWGQELVIPDTNNPKGNWIKSTYSSEGTDQNSDHYEPLRFPAEECCKSVLPTNSASLESVTKLGKCSNERGRNVHKSFTSAAEHAHSGVTTHTKNLQLTTPRTYENICDVDHNSGSLPWRQSQVRDLPNSTVDVSSTLPPGSLGFESVERYLAAAKEWERCSTCSSSSDSEFDYFLDRPTLGGTGSTTAQTGGEQNVGYVGTLSGICRTGPRKINSKQCILS